ncbi:MAG: universal stress protein [Acidobacteria bacterium]|nr:universal stress protein [Acidobacteriota bacterium]
MSEYKTVLATTDFSDAAAAGVTEAIKLARALGAELALLYVAEDRMPPLTFSTEAQRAEIQRHHETMARKSLDEYAAKHLDGLQAKTLLRRGHPAPEIVACAKEIGADIIVMATHGYGSVGQMVFGSTMRRVLAHAGCPVVAVHSR